MSRTSHRPDVRTTNCSSVTSSSDRPLGVGGANARGSAEPPAAHGGGQHTARASLMRRTAVASLDHVSSSIERRARKSAPISATIIASSPSAASASAAESRGRTRSSMRRIRPPGKRSRNSISIARQIRERFAEREAVQQDRTVAELAHAQRCALVLVRGASCHRAAVAGTAHTVEPLK